MTVGGILTEQGSLLDLHESRSKKLINLKKLIKR
jgi:hypothetical protein